MQDCWLEVRLHLEGREFHQLDQGFPWFFSVLDQMLGWHLSSTLPQLASHATLPIVTSEFRPNAVLPKLISKLFPIEYSKKPLFNSSLLVTKSTSKHLTLFHFPKLYPLSNVPPTEGRAASEPSKPEIKISSLHFHFSFFLFWGSYVSVEPAASIYRTTLKIDIVRCTRLHGVTSQTSVIFRKQKGLIFDWTYIT
jgi:hypothetical protein